MITQFKIFENTEELICYGYVPSKKEIVDIYDNIKKLNIDYTFYIFGHLIIFIYTDSETKEKYFNNFYFQKNGDAYIDSPNANLDEYILNLTAKKYNL